MACINLPRARALLLRLAGFAAGLFALTSALAQPNPLVPETPDEVEEEEAAPIDAPPVEAPPVESTASLLTKTDVDAWLDGFMPYALTRGGIVGAVVTVVKDGEILTSRGFGYADLETRAPVDPAVTLFRPGSVSKLITWTAVMQLVEQGKLDLDTDVNDYLDFRIPDAFNAPLTLRHILTHTSGFEEAVKGIIIKDPEALPTLEEYVKTALPARIFPPGETPAYSNYATTLAGYVIARVSGMSFDEYVDQHIFAPAGMTRSTFRQPLPASLAADMSKGYRSAAKGEAEFYELVSPAPAGSMAATGEDMARFMIAHLNGGGALLRPETAREMHSTFDPHTPPLSAMALGFYHQNRGGAEGIGHGGDTIFFHSDLSLFPEQEVGLFVSVNSAGSDTGLGTLAMRMELASKFSDRYFGPAPELGERLDTARAHGEEIAGLYEVSRTSVTNFLGLTRYLGQLKVSVDEDGDIVFPFGGSEWRWREVEPYVWRKIDGHERLAVSMKDGKVHQLSFEPLSPIMVYTLVPAHRASSLLTPLLSIAFGVLVLTVLFWPVRAIVRWRYKKPFALTGASALAYRLVRVGALAVFAWVGMWMFVFTTFSADLSSLTPAFDNTVRIAQFGQFALYAALALALWNAATVWTGGRGWFAALWSALIPLAIIVIIWFAAVTGLLSFNLTY